MKTQLAHRLPFTLLLAAVAALLAGATPAAAQTVTTDQSDYSPGSVVTITGAGWAPNEIVTMVLMEYPQVDPPITLASTADADGNFVNTDFTVLPDDVGIAFTLTATGQLSGASAQTTFTDSNQGNGSLDQPTGSLPETGTVHNNTHWNVQAGDTITATIVNATDAVPPPGCGSDPDGVPVIVKSSDFGNTAVCGTLSGTTITFMWTVPPAACSTTTVAYLSNGNNANNALIPGGDGSSVAGFAIVDADGNVVSCGSTTTTTAPSTTTTTSSTTTTTAPSTTTTTSSTTTTSTTTTTEPTTTSTTTTAPPTTTTTTFETTTTTGLGSTTTTTESSTTTTTTTTSTTTTAPPTTTTTITTTTTTTSSTTTTTSTTTSTTMPVCVPTGPEAGHCNDGIDNDCNHMIDCSDPACQPAVCFGGSSAGQSCEAAADQTACVNGGGVCQCPSIQKDPTSVRFNPRAPGLDRFRSHGRVLTIGGSYPIQTSSVSWLLSNRQGEIFRATLPAGALTVNSAGTTFKFKNRLAKTTGGVSLVKLQNVHGSLKYTVEAYGDLSRATDPNMSIQFYVANQPTPAIHTQAWQKKSNGWTCHSE